MRIFLLADIASVHTEKWALGLAKHGIQVGIFSFNNPHYDWFSGIPNIEVLFTPKLNTKPKTILSKLSYFKYIKALKEKIRSFKPDILHAHYASSYGFFGAKSDFHPFVLSAWGTDVMKFPFENALKKGILFRNLKKADVICATSHTIETYIQKVITKPVVIIPFGIDFKKFSSNKSKKDKSNFVFGAVKSLEKIYNLDVLIKSFALVHQKYPNTNLMIVGDGSERATLNELAKILNISQCVKFTGRVEQNDVPRYLNQLDCFVNISQYESFGVSVIEAMACKVPVIVSDTGGLREVVENTNYGLLSEVGNIEDTAAKMMDVFLNKEAAEIRVQKAYEKANVKYNWENNLLDQINVYKNIVKTN